ncbi:MAG: hypothetical protein EBZ74_06105 [Planctomycetia bacterium]|nr:hypothetical protein [Planctomycetia bacterium]
MPDAMSNAAPDPPHREAVAPLARDGSAFAAWGRGLLLAAGHLGYWLLVWTSSSLLVRIFKPALDRPERSIAIHVVSACLATAALAWLAGRDRLVRRLGLSPLGLVIGGVISVAVAQTLLEDRLFAAAGFADHVPTRSWTVAMLLVRLTALLGWALSYLTLRLIEDQRAIAIEAAKAQAEADRNELKQLQAQMDPHFLFNALNAVLACKRDPEAVETVTQSLAEYLRFCLRETALLEPLGRELDALGKYLTVQELRFGENLVCTIDCQREARDVPAPPMLVQPLLENAFKYGARTSDMPLQVAVAARVARGTLEVEVANTGRWVAPQAGEGGIGMRSLRKRLGMMFGGAATVAAAERDGWVRVTVRLPAGLPHAARPLEEVAT